MARAGDEGKAAAGKVNGAQDGPSEALASAELSLFGGLLVIIAAPGFLCTLLHLVGAFTASSVVPCFLVGLAGGGTLIVRAHLIAGRRLAVFWIGLLAGLVFACSVFGWGLEPIARGLDAVLHGLMFAHYYEDGGIPAWSPNISEGTVYPYFAYVFSIPLGKLAGLDVVATFSLSVIVLIGLLVGAILQWSQLRSRVDLASAAGGLAAGAFLLRSQLITVYYMVNDCLHGELYGMVLLAVGLGTISGLRGGRALRVVVIGFLLACCVLSYPVFVPVLGLALLLLREQASFRERLEDAVLGGLLAAPLSLWWVLRNAAGWAVLSKLTAGGAMGEILQLVSGGLFVLGLVGLAFGWRQRRGWFAGLVLVGTVVLYFGAYKVAQLIVPWTSDRMVLKTMHMLPLGLATLGTVGVASVLRWIGRPRLDQVAVVAAAGLLVWASAIAPEPAEPILGRDAIDLCQQSRQLETGAGLHYLTDTIAGDQWCHVVIRRGPRDQRHLDMWLGAERCFLQEWLVDPRRGSSLLVEDYDEKLGDDYLPEDVELVSRIGDSVLLERVR